MNYPVDENRPNRPRSSYNGGSSYGVHPHARVNHPSFSEYPVDRRNFHPSMNNIEYGQGMNSTYPFCASHNYAPQPMCQVQQQHQAQFDAQVQLPLQYQNQAHGYPHGNAQTGFYNRQQYQIAAYERPHGNGQTGYYNHYQVHNQSSVSASGYHHGNLPYTNYYNANIPPPLRHPSGHLPGSGTIPNLTSVSYVPIVATGAQVSKSTSIVLASVASSYSHLPAPLLTFSGGTIPPTAPLSERNPATEPRRPIMNNHPRPTGCVYNTRPDKTMKDIVITSGGVHRNVVQFAECRYNGETRWVPTLKYENYDIHAHLARMTEDEKADFWSRNYVEIIVDVAEIEELGGRYRKGLPSTSMPTGGLNSEAEEGGNGVDAADSLMASLEGLTLTAGSPEGEEAIAENFEKKTEKGKGKKILEAGQEAGLIISARGNQANTRPKTTHIFEAIKSLGGSFPKYATKVYVSIKFSKEEPMEPITHTYIPNYKGHEEVQCFKTNGAIDIMSTPLFRHMCAIVHHLQDFPSLERLNINLVTQANARKPISIEQLCHVLPFYDLSSFTNWHVWWKSTYFSRSEIVSEWPIMHLNAEWGKICSQRDVEHAAFEAEQDQVIRPKSAQW